MIKLGLYQPLFLWGENVVSHIKLQYYMASGGLWYTVRVINYFYETFMVLFYHFGVEHLIKCFQKSRGHFLLCSLKNISHTGLLGLFFVFITNYSFNIEPLTHPKTTCEMMFPVATSYQQGAGKLLQSFGKFYTPCT